MRPTAGHIETEGGAQASNQAKSWRTIKIKQFAHSTLELVRADVGTGRLVVVVNDWQIQSAAGSIKLSFLTNMSRFCSTSHIQFRLCFDRLLLHRLEGDAGLPEQQRKCEIPRSAGKYNRYQRSPSHSTNRETSAILMGEKQKISDAVTRLERTKPA